MDDEGGRPHARRSYRGCWLFQQDASNCGRQQRSGQHASRIDSTGRVVTGAARDISERTRERARFSAVFCAATDYCSGGSAVRTTCRRARRFRAGLRHVCLGDPGLRARRFQDLYD
jgi:hypothetical protein